MKRVAALFLPMWPIERLRQADRAARPALSDPKKQKFLVKVTHQN